MSGRSSLIEIACITIRQYDRRKGMLVNCPRPAVGRHSYGSAHTWTGADNGNFRRLPRSWNSRWDYRHIGNLSTFVYFCLGPQPAYPQNAALKMAVRFSGRCKCVGRGSHDGRSNPAGTNNARWLACGGYRPGGRCFNIQVQIKCYLADNWRGRAGVSVLSIWSCLGDLAFG